MEEPKRHETLRTRMGRRTATATAVWWLAGLAVRLSCQDQFDGLAVLFYATPWPVLMLLPVIPAVWWGHERKYRRAAAAAIAIAGCGIAWLSLGWFSGPIPPAASAPEPPSLRVLFRNLGHPDDAAWPRDLAATAHEDADLVGLVEGQSDSPERQRQLRAAFPDHAVVRFPHELALAVRGEILESALHEFDFRSRCVTARVRIRDRALTVFLVDLESTPWRSRRQSFAQLDALRREHAGETVIMMGDFNTPRESVYFRPWRETLRHAFETAGRGFAETWPWPLPVLCLDHVWSTPDLPATQCQRRRYRPHDHAGLLITFPGDPTPPLARSVVGSE